MNTNSPLKWWQQGVFYHIYPQSFKDSNADGYGDLRGIIQQMDYLCEFGIDAIWLSPVYRSPMIDCGYDISDYTQTDPMFGSINDLKELITLAHAQGIRVIMDLVMNHTSDQHPWFKASQSSKESPLRDWYIWRKSFLDKRPNNWKTNFGASVWQYDPTTEEYYYHSFFKEQPDLNWRNETMKEAFFAYITNWLEFGVDGFRLDVVNMLVKEDHFDSVSYWKKWMTSKYSPDRNQPETYEIIRSFRKLLDSYPDKTSIGEIYVLPPGDTTLAASFLGNNDLLHMAFDFSLIFTPWSAHLYYKVIQKWYRALAPEGWPSFVLSNHDLGRYGSRIALGINRQAKIKILSTLLLTLRGTPFIYYGDEIGLCNTHIPRKKIKDPYGRMLWPIYTGRDKYRTPMQWNNSAYAGFSTVEPWLPVSSSYKQVNVLSQRKDEHSIFNHYKRLIQLRKHHISLHSGTIHFLSDGRNGILAYTRKQEDETCVIVLNFTFRSQKLVCEDLKKALVLHSTHRIPETPIPDTPLILFPYEATLFIKNG